MTLPSTTPNRFFYQPSYNYGTNPGDVTWEQPINSNSTYLDQILGQTVTVSLASTTPVALTNVQSQYMRILFTGALTANITIQFPNIGGYWIVDNRTSGAFTVRLSSAGGGNSLLIPQNTRLIVFNDISTSAYPGIWLADDGLLTSTFSTITVTGNATIGGTLGVTGATTLNSTLAVTGDSTLTGALSVTGATTLGASTATSLSAAGSTTAIALKTPNIVEDGTYASATWASTMNYDVTTQSVNWITTNTSANWILNIRGNATTSLSSLLPNVGDTITVAMIVQNSTTAYYNTSVQIDGTVTGVTTYWQGGSAPTTGNASAKDTYTYTVIKTAATPTYSVLASITKFA